MQSSATIESIFDCMLARYGSAWRAKWQGVSPEAVKADWANVLSGYGNSAIGYGLSYLPDDFPPTASQFAAICRRAPAKPESKPKQLAMPEVTEEQRQRVRDLLAATRAKLTARPAPSPPPVSEVVDTAARDRAKADMDRRVAEYARAKGLSLDLDPAPSTRARSEGRS
jgi:hypothetical protein